MRQPISTNKLRIIAGQWRGRKFNFPAIPGLRPTSDRIRETVFNWLAPLLPGAYCLDLFAGSGALGFEALSRGAKHVCLIDQAPEVIQHLRQIAEVLKTAEATIMRLTIPAVLPTPKQPYDIVFLDPPFHQNLLADYCQWLEQSQVLAKEAYIYLEAEASLGSLPVPQNWEILKSKQAGQVGYHLLKRRVASESLL